MKYCLFVLLGCMAIGLRSYASSTNNTTIQRLIKENTVLIDGQLRGPIYSEYDIAALKGAESIISLLQKNFENNQKRGDQNLHLHLFPRMQTGNFYAGIYQKTGEPQLEWRGTSRNTLNIGNMISDGDYESNPLVTAVANDRREVVEAIIRWLRTTLKKIGAQDDILRLYLDYPAANFGVGSKKGCFIVGPALVWGTPDMIKYLLEQGATGAVIIKGSPVPEDEKASGLITCTKADGSLGEIKKIVIEDLIKNTGLSLEQSVYDRLRAIRKEQLKKEVKEEEAQERKQQERTEQEARQEKIRALAKKTRRELKFELSDFIMQKDLPMIQEIEKIDPRLLTENLDWSAIGQTGPAPIVLAHDCAIIKYLAEHHAKQERPLGQADIEKMVSLTPLDELNKLETTLNCWKQLGINAKIDIRAMMEKKKSDIKKQQKIVG